MVEKNKLLNVVLIGILIFLLFKYAFGGLLPIILGWLVSLLVYPIGNWLSKKIKLPRKFLCGTLVIIFFLLLIFSVGIGLRRLFFELELFAMRLEENPEIVEGAFANIKESFGKFKIFSRFESIISSFGEYAYIADEIINNLLDTTLASLGSFVSSAAKSIVLGIPTALLFLITLVMSAFYFSVDRDRIYALFGSLLPEKIKNKVASFTEGGIRAAVGYIKSCMILMTITFFEMLIFLMFLRVQYSLLLSIIIAIVDVLPLLGVGAVLVPWSVYCFITSDVRMGAWLLVIFLVATILRNILEPKILGKKIGVHPFLIIASAYLGFKIFGGGGLLLAPILVATLFTVKNEKKLTPYK